MKPSRDRDYVYRYAPIPPAKRFHESAAKIRCIVCGARSGKTRATIGGELVSDAFWQPGYYARDIRDGEPYSILVCEPTFKMVKIIAWKLVLKALDPSRIVGISEVDRIIEFQGVHGITQIVFASYEQGSEKIEGISLYRAYLDEVFQCPESFFDEVLVRLSDRRGRVVMVGTPKPVAWIMDRIIEKADEATDIFFTSWKTRDNPYFPKDELDRLASILPPKIFSRNFEGCLDAFQGQVYEMFDKKVHAKNWEINLDDYQVLWGSQDHGWTHNGVMLIFGLRDDDEVDVLFEVSEPNIPPVSDSERSWAGIQLEHQNMRDDIFHRFFAGPDRPENIEASRRKGVRIKAADDSVMEGIQFVSTLLHVDERGKSKLRIHAKNCPKLIKRIPAYQWQENSDGSLSEKPRKRDDDECDSFRYGLFSMRKWFKIWDMIGGDEVGENIDS